MADRLNKLVFGRKAIFSPEWHQGLHFCDNEDMRFGLIQRKGGPCGVIAPIQAFLLVELLFSSPPLGGSNAEKLLNPSDDRRRESLCKVLAEMLWMIGELKRACVVLSPSVPRLYESYKLTDWEVNEFHSFAILHSFLQAHWNAVSSAHIFREVFSARIVLTSFFPLLKVY
jgi:hypothetical protein